MARRAIRIRDVVNAEGVALVGPDGQPIRAVVWQEVPVPSPGDPGPLGYDPAVARARFEAERGRAAARLEPKRYRLAFVYADGEERAVEDATAEDAVRNEEIGRALHGAPLVSCRTERLRAEG